MQTQIHCTLCARLQNETTQTTLYYADMQQPATLSVTSLHAPALHTFMACLRSSAKTHLGNIAWRAICVCTSHTGDSHISTACASCKHNTRHQKVMCTGVIGDMSQTKRMFMLACHTSSHHVPLAQLVVAATRANHPQGCGRNFMTS